MMNRIMNSLSILVMLTGTASLAGCDTSGMTQGSLLGGGIGALAGQAIGGDTESTLIGAGVGALGGAIIGNEMEHQQRRQRQATHAGNNGQTTRRSETRRVLNPDGSYTVVGEETTTSEETTGGYTGLPNN